MDEKTPEFYALNLWCEKINPGFYVIEEKIVAVLILIASLH